MNKWINEHMRHTLTTDRRYADKYRTLFYQLYDANDDFDDYYYPKMVIGGPIMWSDGFWAGCQIYIFILFL